MSVPHDGGYKYLFSNPVVFHQFLTRFVDEPFIKKIAVSDIAQVDRSFVSDNLRKRESDIIYKVGLPHNLYFYILVEMQSTPDKTIPVRMLLYILQLYDHLYRKSQKGKLPAVFPILLYNGLKPWNTPFNISDLISHSIPQRYIPSFEYYCIQEHALSDTLLKKIKGLVAAVFYLEKGTNEQEIRRRVDDIYDMIKTEFPKELGMFVNWLNARFKSIHNENNYDILQKEEAAHVLDQVIAQMEAKYRRRGMREGIKQGIEQGKLEDARNMLAKGLSVEFIHAITGLDEEKIQSL